MNVESNPTEQGRQDRGTYPTALGRLLRAPLGTTLAALAAAVLLAACSSGSTAASSSGEAGQDASSGHVPLDTGQISGIGTVLTNPSRMTAYEAQQESGDKIMCIGSCLSFWYPVTVSKGTTPHATGVTGKLSTIKRQDTGAIQLTINGHPLYTFRQDSGPGSAAGNDYSDSFGGRSFTWHALTTAGTPAPAAGAGSTPASSSYGY